MAAENLKPAIRAALRWNEIGNGSPYKLSFAGVAQSGGSFGAMQGDLAKGQAFVKQTLRDALAAAGVAAAKIDSLLHVLSAPHLTNPLSKADTQTIDDALLKGHALVDAMDEKILVEVYAGTDACLAAADDGQRTIEPKALLYLPLWINMTGAPSRILDWLRGQDVGHGIPVAPNTVDVAAIEGYLRKQKYYVENPKLFGHMQESVKKGIPLLP